MFIRIDKKKCVGCGRCAEICPHLFRLNNEGKAEVVSQKDLPCASRAADDCIVEAIFVEE